MVQYRDVLIKINKITFQYFLNKKIALKLYTLFKRDKRRKRLRKDFLKKIRKRPRKD